AAADRAAAEAAVFRETHALIEYAVARGSVGGAFVSFEMALVARVAAFARTLIALFTVVSEKRVAAGLSDRMVRGGRLFRRAPAHARNLLTWFGIVRYRRTYMREVTAGKGARGFHPLDAELGLLAGTWLPRRGAGRAVPGVALG